MEKIETIIKAAIEKANEDLMAKLNPLLLNEKFYVNFNCSVGGIPIQMMQAKGVLRISDNSGWYAIQPPLAGYTLNSKHFTIKHVVEED